MSIVKSGWLHRQSTILRRWKRNWFDLWADGRLVFYDDQERRDMEDDLHMRVDCINIRGSKACKDLNPPEGKGCDSLLQIVCRDGRVISLCADSSDDALAWTMALQDARVNAVLAPPQMAFAQEAIASAPPPYSEFAVPPQTYNPYGEYVTPPPQATQIVYSADGQPYAVAYPYQYQDQSYPYQYQGQSYPYQYQGVYPSHQAVNHVIVQERQRDDTGDVALGMLAGAATGLAIGSLFSVF
ncbi:pleckstrin homology domain-containing family B member 2 isoform X1 [Gadus chalcogrammus]|uniref:pleckstrin homology domain-containing family B member 2 isoform X1 n=1 Tax=Gadus chalcogrammus TaxID=1042646 RepID=UPI0024C4DE25|nr:pleckstrin homology domain-containing family B member 2 isoform X1 [Gadus chalcogrammus]XP_056460557.1 pleckstrin homology domain-containing family B member 2 isoform X1 [Gadus chalcogrammus]XP_056460558.1 pleckstrin homology domain-containing family B member 2 isoform X1 [Gadus chalcogrammus]XP_056460559.1 pleckstrin homology domain-containing family B member 2 isoform X1 [Gadus chalcogrammus]XP_056460560.1 pleckstrin homology domain-containing family B member 2 isoform X1 [Gadus chalcogram